MKNYEAPKLKDFGSVSEITAVFGNPGTGDVFIVDGEITERDVLSRDICVTDNDVECAPGFQIPT